MLIKCRFFILTLTLFELTVLTGCTSINSGVGGYFDLDTDLAIEFKVSADINPDDNSRPSPLFIRMYEMKAKKMIKKADFIDLYERDKEVLGADMLAVQKLKRLIPGEDREDNFVLSKNTLYVALYAEFLQYKNAKFKLIIPVVPNNIIATTVTVEVSGNTLKLVEKGSSGNDEKETDEEEMDEESTEEKNNDQAVDDSDRDSKKKDDDDGDDSVQDAVDKIKGFM